MSVVVVIRRGHLAHFLEGPPLPRSGTFLHLRRGCVYHYHPESRSLLHTLFSQVRVTVDGANHVAVAQANY